MNQYRYNKITRHQPLGPSTGLVGRAKRRVGNFADRRGVSQTDIHFASDILRRLVPDSVAHPINRLLGSPSRIITAQDFVPLAPRFKGEAVRTMTIEDVQRALSVNLFDLERRLQQAGYDDASKILSPIFGPHGQLILTPRSFDLGEGRFSLRDSLSSYVRLTPRMIKIAVESLHEVEGFGDSDLYDLLNIWAAYQLERTGTQVVIEGWEQLTPGEQFVFAPTHFANIEYGPLFMMLNLMGCNMSIVLKDDLSRNKFTGEMVGLRELFHTFNRIFIEINRKDCKTAKQVIDKTAQALRKGGTSNIIYPAGTRNPKRWDARGHRIDGALPDKLKGGVWYLAQGSGLRVVPISTNGVGRAAGRDEWDPSQRGQVMRILIGKPVSVDDFASKEDFLAYLQDFYKTHSEDHVYERL